MNRTRCIQLCLLKSLQKRLWLLLLVTFTVSIGLFLFNVSLGQLAALDTITLLIVSGGVARSSYQRHRYEFDHYTPQRAERSLT